MDALLSTLQSAFPDPNTQRLLLIGSLAVATLFLGLGLSALVLGATDPIRRRLSALGAEASEHIGVFKSLGVKFQAFSKRFTPSSTKERDSVQRQLTYAGFRSPNALPVYYGIKTLLALVLGMTVFTAARWVPQFSSSEVLFYTAVAAGIGVVAPNYALRRLVASRQKKLRNGFPDALDMLVVCVEAGLGLTAAIQRVSEELQFSHPELAEELARVNAETRAGVEREAALRHLTERTGLDDIRGLVSLLIQTLRFGTSVADTLRVYSEEFRDRRMQRAEEQAAKIGTKLIFPLVFCLFPAFFVVAIGPAVIRLIDVFSKLGANVAN